MGLHHGGTSLPGNGVDFPGADAATDAQTVSYARDHSHGVQGDWIQQAIDVLRENGYDIQDSDANLIAAIIQHESGGNPQAINMWDSNAAAGHPSKGLMQTIDSTFNSHALPGHGNIWNPVDNIIAGTRYAIARYGSLDNVPGIAAMRHGGGYMGY
jgi:SLT domain-containing protein